MKKSSPLVLDWLLINVYKPVPNNNLSAFELLQSFMASLTFDQIYYSCVASKSFSDNFSVCKIPSGRLIFWELYRESLFVQKRWNNWGIKWKRKGVDKCSSRPGERPLCITQICVGEKQLTSCFGSQSALVTRSAHIGSLFQSLQISPSS